MVRRFGLQELELPAMMTIIFISSQADECVPDLKNADDESYK
jgi:hypothetical protein